MRNILRTANEKREERRQEHQQLWWREFLEY